MSRRRLVGLLELEPFLFFLGSETTHFSLAACNGSSFITVLLLGSLTNNVLSKMLVLLQVESTRKNECVYIRLHYILYICKEK